MIIDEFQYREAHAFHTANESQEQELPLQQKQQTTE